MESIDDILTDNSSYVKNYYSNTLANAIAYHDNPNEYKPVKVDIPKATLEIVSRFIQHIDRRIKKTGKLSEQYLTKKLRHLHPEYRIAIKNHLRTNYYHNDSVAILLSQWDDVEAVADLEKPSTTKYAQRRRVVWDVLESSVPIMLGTELWYVRILYHRKEKRKYIDIREWRQNVYNIYEPTMKGYCVPIENEIKLLYVIQKLITKHNS